MATPGPRYVPPDPTLPKPWKGLIDGTTGYLYLWNLFPHKCNSDQDSCIWWHAFLVLKHQFHLIFFAAPKVRGPSKRNGSCTNRYHDKGFCIRLSYAPLGTGVADLVPNWSSTNQLFIRIRRGRFSMRLVCSKVNLKILLARRRHFSANVHRIWKPHTI
jgi:hypothetical protein